MTRGLIGFLLGLAIFFSGLLLVKGSAQGLETRIGPFLRSAVRRPLWGVVVGFCVTAVLQSSSATNAATVGFVAAGVLTFRQAFPVVLGANIGTTLTGQLIAFGLYDLGLPLMVVGFSIGIFSRGGSRSVGAVGAGLGGILFGLQFMSQALVPLTEHPLFLSILMLSNTHDGAAVVGGTLMTAVVQSSSAVTGLLVGLTDTGVFPVRGAVAACLGSNVGTVFTTILAAVTGGTAARRTAFADLLFNIFGVMLFFPILGPYVHWIEGLSSDPGRQVAHAHTFLNVFTVFIVLPFLHPICSWIERLTPPRQSN